MWRVFLHERARDRFLAGMGAALVVGQTMITTYFSEASAHQGGRRSAYDAAHRLVSSSRVVLTAENVLHWGGLPGSLHLGNVEDPSDIGWRLLTWVLGTCWGLWLVLLLPALPFPCFEGSRFSREGVMGFGRRWLRRFVRVASWVAGIAVGAILTCALVLASIPFTLWLKSSFGFSDDRAGLIAVSVFTGVVVGTLVLFRQLVYRWVTPALAICITLSVIILAEALFMWCNRAVAPTWMYLGGLALLVLVIWANSTPYKLTFPGLEDWYRPPATHQLDPGPDAVGGPVPSADSPATRESDAVAPPAPRTAPGTETNYRAIQDEKALRILNYFTLSSKRTPAADRMPDAPDQEALIRRWAEHMGGLPKLAVVTTSGGALRAAVWTATVLDALGPGLAPHIRMITGASGGMLGAAAYVEGLRTGSRPLEMLRVDSLDEVARRLALYDIPAIVMPWRQGHDRGRTLESSWNFLSATFGDLKQHEDRWELPSLVFSPMLVQDGRRLILSNLNLEVLTRPRGSILLDGGSRKLYGDFYSQSALEFDKIFPGALKDLSVRTAVRMSASFPYVSPAVSLPTIPPRSVVDAGYYDNFGVNLACNWLYHHREVLSKVTSGVVLIQIRDHLGQKDRFEFTDDTGALGRINRGLAFLTAPLSGASHARYATASFRNDEQVAALASAFRPKGEDFFTTAIFEFQNDGEVALNWQLSPDESHEIEGGMASDKNRERAEALAAWWGPPQVRPQAGSGATSGSATAQSSASNGPDTGRPPSEAATAQSSASNGPGTGRPP
jgi:hypothetical protein